MMVLPVEIPEDSILEHVKDGFLPPASRKMSFVRSARLDLSDAS